MKRSKQDIASPNKQSAEATLVQQLALTELSLHDLQIYTHDLIIKNNASKHGSVRSTRAFADPLLNLEMKLLRKRETDL